MMLWDAKIYVKKVFEADCRVGEKIRMGKSFGMISDHRLVEE